MRSRCQEKRWIPKCPWAAYRKSAGGVTTDYVYDLSGNVIAERQGSNWTIGYVYLNGKLLAQYKDGTTHFAEKDHLGLTRLLTRVDATVLQTYDYMPFGEEYSGSSVTTYKFTGKQRDAESGLDYFGARHYSSLLGRFVSVDPSRVSVQLFNPQSWNRYSYALNDPLVYVDPNGKWFTPVHNQIIDEVFRMLSEQEKNVLEDCQPNH